MSHRADDGHNGALGLAQLARTGAVSAEEVPEAALAGVDARILAIAALVARFDDLARGAASGPWTRSGAAKEI